MSEKRGYFELREERVDLRKRKWKGEGIVILLLLLLGVSFWGSRAWTWRDGWVYWFGDFKDEYEEVEIASKTVFSWSQVCCGHFQVTIEIIAKER